MQEKFIDEEKLNPLLERVFAAVKEIQEFCSNADCDNCPFVDDDSACKLKENFPNQWNF